MPLSTSLQGQFLIANRSLPDPNFWRSVILMLEHHAEGASGVVINKPSPMRVMQALEDHYDLPDTEALIHVGGPVGQNGMMVLHNSSECDSEEQQITPGVYLGANAESFEQLMRGVVSDTPGLRFRIFSGCAGWGPGQLEGELRRNDWHVIPAKGEYVFAEDPYAIWDELVTEFHRSQRIIPQKTEHPEWN